MRDVVVIGAGIAGLAAAVKAARAGQSVTLITKGVGGLQLGTGTVDVVGYSADHLVEAPLEELSAHLASRATHPYTHFTPDYVGEAVNWLRDTLGESYLLGDASRNVRIPTGVGALRPTALYQPSMEAGIPKAGARYAIVGLNRLKDFYPSLVAENLSRQNGPDGTPLQARALSVDYVVREGEIDSTGVNHARSLDLPENRERLAALIRPLLEDGEIVGLPAVLGLNDLDAWKDLSERLGHEVFEIPMQPPSVPGMRLNAALSEIVKYEARLMLGASIESFEARDGRLVSVTVSTAGRPTRIEARHFIVAAGGFESGALEVDSYGTIRDTVLNLPILGPEGHLLHGDFWGEDQPLFLAGLAVDDAMRPLDASGTPVYVNVYAAGGNLAGATRWREKSGEGIALASAARAVDTIVEETK